MDAATGGADGSIHAETIDGEKSGATDGGCLFLFGGFGKRGEDEAVEGGRGLGSALGSGKRKVESGKRVGKRTLALLAEVAVQPGLVGTGGGVGLKASLPLGELRGVGIDGLDLLREVLERAAGSGLRFGGPALVGVLDDVSLLHAVADAIDDLVATLQRAVDVSNGGCGIDFSHRKVGS